MSSNITIKKIISFIKSELKDLYPASEIDSFIFMIFEHLLGYSRTRFLISQDQEVTDKDYRQILMITKELKLNKPIQYILGHTYFYDLTFQVEPGVLIPRPETEELVDWIIQENSKKQLKILDIGTGSGCIAISLAKNLPESKVLAADISKKAIKITNQNAILNKVDIEIIELDIINFPEDLNLKFDIIVSNPPYVTEQEKSLMNKNVLDYEPDLALFVPDNDPLRFYTKIAEFGLVYLNKGGKIYFEINESFGEETVLMLENKAYYKLELRKDINGKNRMIRGILK